MVGEKDRDSARANHFPSKALHSISSMSECVAAQVMEERKLILVLSAADPHRARQVSFELLREAAMPVVVEVPSHDVSLDDWIVKARFHPPAHCHTPPKAGESFLTKS